LLFKARIPNGLGSAYHLSIYHRPPTRHDGENGSKDLGCRQHRPTTILLLVGYCYPRRVYYRISGGSISMSTRSLFTCIPITYEGTALQPTGKRECRRHPRLAGSSAFEGCSRPVDASDCGKPRWHSDRPQNGNSSMSPRTR
jgi:hypothetical protein